MEIRENEKAVAGYGRLRLLAVAQGLAIGVYALIVEFVSRGGFVPPQPFGSGDAVRAALLMVSVALFFAAGRLRERMLQPRFDALEEALVPGERLRRMLVANAIALALCELPALFALVFFFLGGTRADFYFFAALALGFLFARYPGGRQWQAWYAQRARLR